MALHENTTVRPPVERSQAGESAADRKRIYRMYPSLPNVDSYEVCVLNRSSEEKPRDSAVYHPDSLLEEIQSEASAASAEVRMKAQMSVLEEQRQELLTINEKWAREYRTMTEYYKEKVRDLKALLRHDCGHYKEELCEEEEKNATLCKKIKDKESAQTAHLDVSSELLKAEREAEELRAQNSTLTKKWRHQCEEIRRLNKALEEALVITQPLDVSSETLQDIWKHQAEVYKEDFLRERKDREKLKDKYLELEKKFRKVCSELRVLKPQATRTRPPEPAYECTCNDWAKCPNWEARQTNQQQKPTQRRDNKL